VPERVFRRRGVEVAVGQRAEEPPASVLSQRPGPGRGEGSRAAWSVPCPERAARAFRNSSWTSPARQAFHIPGATDDMSAHVRRYSAPSFSTSPHRSANQRMSSGSERSRRCAVWLIVR
jgi:hypothetical protein